MKTKKIHTNEAECCEECCLKVLKAAMVNGKLSVAGIVYGSIISRRLIDREEKMKTENTVSNMNNAKTFTDEVKLALFEIGELERDNLFFIAKDYFFTGDYSKSLVLKRIQSAIELGRQAEKLISFVNEFERIKANEEAELKEISLNPEGREENEA